MKEKILNAIKTKFPTAKLSAKRLDAIAASIEAKAGTDEGLIDSTLDALNELYPLTEIAKDDHIRSTLEGKLKATQTKKEETTETAEEKAAREQAEALSNIDKDTPAWAKALIDQNKKLAEGLAAIQGEKVANTIKGKATEILKDVPVEFWDEWKLPDNEDGLPAFTEKVKTKFQTINQQRADAGLSVLGSPKSGSGSNTKEKASEKEIAAVVDAIM